MSEHGAIHCRTCAWDHPTTWAQDTNWLTASPGAEEQPTPGAVPKRAESGSAPGSVEATRAVRIAGHQGLVDAHSTAIP